MLTLEKTADPAANVQPGGLITHTLTVSAPDFPAGGVVLSDTLPAHTDFVTASAPYSYTSAPENQIGWAIGDLAAGQTVTHTLTVRVAPEAPVDTDDPQYALQGQRGQCCDNRRPAGGGAGAGAAAAADVVAAAGGEGAIARRMDS